MERLTYTHIDTDIVECPLCLVEGEPDDFIRPCRDTDHLCCATCWREWSEAHPEMILPCPSCRLPTFKDPLRQCRSFQIVREEDHEIIHTAHYENIYDAYEAFREYVERQSLQEEYLLTWYIYHDATFFLPDTEISHTLSPRLFACSHPTTDLAELYHQNISSIEIGSDTISSIHSSELSEMNDEYEQDEAYIEWQASM